MRKMWKRIISLLMFGCLVFGFQKEVVAQNCDFSVDKKDVTVDDGSAGVNISIRNIGLQPGVNYDIIIYRSGVGISMFEISKTFVNNEVFPFNVNNNNCPDCFDPNVTHRQIKVVNTLTGIDVCQKNDIFNLTKDDAYANYTISYPDNKNNKAGLACIDNTDDTGDVEILVSKAQKASGYSFKNVTIFVNGERYPASVGTPITIPKSRFKTGSNNLVIEGGLLTNGSFFVKNLEEFDIVKFENCTENTVSSSNSGSGKPITISPQECDSDGDGIDDGLRTSLGCVPYETAPLVGWLLRYGISIGGGIAFLLMAWGAFLYSTSAGDQEKVKQGKEIITSALAGLLFIIFSVFLLHLIGVQIFKIPGFGN